VPPPRCILWQPVTLPPACLCGLCVPPASQEAAKLRASLQDSAKALEASEAGRKQAGDDLARVEGAKAAAEQVGRETLPSCEPSLPSSPPAISTLRQSV
jgi:hypothetical protein